MRVSRLLIVPFLLLTTSVVYGQSDTAVVHELRLRDGTEIRGYIVSEDSADLLFRTLGGAEMKVRQASVLSVRPLEGRRVGDAFYHSDPNRTRLFFAPTARSLPAGSGYFSIYEIFFPMIAVGATDWLTLAGGVSLFPGATSQLVYLAPKVRAVHTEHLDVAAGVLYLSIPEVTRGVGIAYGVLTAGKPTAAFTAGLGWGFIGSEFGDAPSIVLGGEVQLSESVKLLSENWIPAGADGAILSFGIRFFGEHIAGDFGLITTTEASGSFPFFPWVGFVYNF